MPCQGCFCLGRGVSYDLSSRECANTIPSGGICAAVRLQFFELPTLFLSVARHKTGKRGSYESGSCFSGKRHLVPSRPCRSLVAHLSPAFSSRHGRSRQVRQATPPRFCFSPASRPSPAGRRTQKRPCRNDMVSEIHGGSCTVQTRGTLPDRLSFYKLSLGNYHLFSAFSVSGAWPKRGKPAPSRYVPQKNQSEASGSRA